MTDWTGAIGLNGLGVGEGTPYAVIGLSGWFDYDPQPLGGSESTSSTVIPAPNPLMDGSFPVPYFMPSRTVVLDLDITETSDTTFQEAVDALAAATLHPQGLALPLSMTIGGVVTTVSGNMAREIPTELEYQFGLSQAVITATCPDPRRYAALVTETVSITGSSHAVTLTNAGNTATPVKFAMSGPLEGVSIANTTSGITWGLYSATTIASGATWTADTRYRTLTDASGTNENATVSTLGGWFWLMPGANDLTITQSASTTSASQVVFSFASAWL